MKKNCHSCNKKLSIIEELTSKCKCDNFFCKDHKFSFLHECSYNYIEEYKNKSNSNIIKFENKVIKI